MSTSSISRGAISNFIARLAAVGLGLAILAIVARQGPHQQGMFSLLVATEAVFAALFSGFGLVVARQVSHHREAVSSWLGGALVLALSAGLAGALAFGWSSSLLAQDSAYRYLAPLAWAAPLLLLAPTVSGLCLGLGRMGPINALAVAPPILTLLVLGLLWASGGSPTLWQVILAWLACRAATGIGAAILASRAHGLAAPRWPAWRGQAGFCAVIGMTNLVSWLNYRADLFIVERMVGLAPAGIYAIAVSVAELLWFVSSSVSAAAYARIGSPDREQAASLTVRVVHLNIGVLLVVSPLLVVVAWWVLPRVLGQAYEASLPLLLLLLPGVWAYASASALSAYYTNFLGRPHLSATVAGTSLAINLLLCVLLVPTLGAAGGAIATSVSYLVAICWGLALFRRHAQLSWRTILQPDWLRLVRDMVSPWQRLVR